MSRRRVAEKTEILPDPKYGVSGISKICQHDYAVAVRNLSQKPSCLRRAG